MSLEEETHFWAILDRYGPSNLPSDMWEALELLVERDARASPSRERQHNGR